MVAYIKMSATCKESRRVEVSAVAAVAMAGAARAHRASERATDLDVRGARDGVQHVVRHVLGLQGHDARVHRLRPADTPPSRNGAVR